MNPYPTMELDRRFAAVQPNDQATTPWTERLINLSSWMMVLGTVRLVCMLADGASAIVEAVRIESFSMRAFARVADEIHPVVAISAAWPLVLAIALRRARWPQLVPAAAATFFVLSIGGILELWLQWGQARGYGGMVGSFHLTRRAFLRPNASRCAARASERLNSRSSSPPRFGRCCSFPARAPRRMTPKRKNRKGNQREHGGRDVGGWRFMHQSGICLSRSGYLSGPRILRCSTTRRS